MSKQKTVAIFLPQMGCAHACTFCNQHAITATTPPSPTEVRTQIATAYATIPDGTRRELAFFGGTFTALPRARMIAYLEAACDFRFDAIRLSTRPDEIDAERLALLKQYGVTHIELGIQSLDDTVLSAVRRGHTADVARDACRDVVNAGFVLGGQMMIGLPCATAQSELETARGLCALGARQARIYPLCVFDHTPLAAQVASGNFTPLSLTEAVRRSADVLSVLQAHGVHILRIGLCANEGLCESAAQSGFHPAFGELVYATLYCDRIAALLGAHDAATLRDATATVSVAPHALSRAIGQKRQNITALLAQFPLRDLRVQPDPSLEGNACMLTLSKQQRRS